MYTYVKSLVERNLSINAPIIQALVLNQPTDIIPDSTWADGEIAKIWLFNAGNTNIYIAYGIICNPSVGNYHLYIAPQQLVEIPTRQKVSCYSVTPPNQDGVDGKVSTIIVYRTAGPNNTLPNIIQP